MSNDNDIFEQSVQHYCKGLDAVSIGCLGAECEYSDGNEDHQCETSFSWGQCDSCGSTLGGDRSEAYGMWRDGAEFNTIKMSVCIDCMMYHANGELPHN